ncbi:hypothetical protein [Paraburkholderia sp. MM5477-R1]|uniref:hypothetical protein n=1 Tax=Paraburkholderia sp. MM5477-R1 TaxID=2991062 RepID=UPI003D1B107F
MSRLHIIRWKNAAKDFQSSAPFSQLSGESLPCIEKCIPITFAKQESAHSNGSVFRPAARTQKAPDVKPDAARRYAGCQSEPSRIDGFEHVNQVSKR